MSFLDKVSRMLGFNKPPSVVIYDEDNVAINARPPIPRDTVSTMEELIVYLKSFQRLKGLYTYEVENIEKKIGHVLPAVYKRFLGVMGRDASAYMLGSSVFYNELMDLQEGAEDLMLENNLPPLPANCFVFWMHQGYQAAFFLLNDGDDPPVYFFGEGGGTESVVKMTYTLTDFFIFQLSYSYLHVQFQLPEVPPLYDKPAWL